MKQTLEQQIAKLTAKHNLQTKVENKLPGIESIYTNDFNHKGKGTKFTFTVNLDELPLKDISAKIEQVIKAFPPTRNNCLLFAGKDDHPTGSPFMLVWDNGIRHNKVKIDWVSGDFWCHIALPIGYYSDDVKGVFMRKVYDTEHHYFGGVSMDRISKMQITSYKLDMFESCKYYGGDVTNFVEDFAPPEEVKEFENVVLKGHTPEFTEFWQKHLAK